MNIDEIFIIIMIIGCFIIVLSDIMHKDILSYIGIIFVLIGLGLFFYYQHL